MAKLDKQVKVIRIELTMAGGKREAIFIRRAKIAELLADKGSLGEFLRDLRDAPLVEPKVQ